MSGTQSQLGGLVGGSWKTKWKIARVGLELGTSSPEPRVQQLHHTHTYYYFSVAPQAISYSAMHGVWFRVVIIPESKQASLLFQFYIVCNGTNDVLVQQLLQ